MTSLLNLHSYDLSVENESMSFRELLGGLVVLLIVTIAWSLSVGSTRTSQDPAQVVARASKPQRQAIKQMPILQRPSRPGHFYGNTVRRRYSRQTYGR